MSDTGVSTDTTTPIAMPPASEPGAPVTDDLAAPPDDQSVFSRGYVEKLRGEAQRYRDHASEANNQLQTYDQVFGVYPEGERQIWLNMASAWAQNPEAAVQMMEEISNNYRAENTQQQPQTPPPEATPQLSPDEVKQLVSEQLAARDASVAEQRAIQGIFDEVRTAGFDPETAEGFAVLYNANHFTDGDIGKAVQMVKDRDQKVINEYIAHRNGRPMPSPQGGVMAAAAGEPIKTIEDARRATEAFLRERQGAR